MSKQLEVGTKVRFGATRVMTVVAAVPYGSGHVTQKLTLQGRRGGAATAYVFADGRIRMQ
jgi:hypothetical protein